MNIPSSHCRRDFFHHLLSSAIVMVLLTATPAHAGIYIEGVFGLPGDDPAKLIDDDSANTDYEFDFDTQSALSIAAGLDWGIIRNELELTFRDTEGLLLETDPPSADAGSGNFDSISLMTNLYLDIPTPLGFDIFVGGGVGIVMFDGEASGTGSLSNIDLGDAAYGYAWQLKTGVALHLTRNLDFTVGYRYWRAGEIDFGEFTLDETEVHALDLGLRLTF